MNANRMAPARRRWLAGAVALVGAAGWRGAWAASGAGAEGMWKLTDAQWRARLKPEVYRILREQGTERPFSHPLNQEHRRGLFACAGCELALFSSDTKFDSGTGWPSFWKPLPGAVTQSDDHSLGMDRTEVACSRCGGHLGHVFDDGPAPTGLRYCMNGLALIFRPAQGAALRPMITGVLASLFVCGTSLGAEEPVHLPAPVHDDALHAGPLRQAVFAGGCFWGVQMVFQHIKGVTSAVSGYAGGAAATADYESVSSGMTGHAESVQVTYDPAVVSYGSLMRVFFSVAHDPTQLDRQGPDEGTQYRSAIFTLDEHQALLARDYIRQIDASGLLAHRVATRVEALPAFFAAEAYHQDYATLHPESRYIAINDLPKVKALARIYPEYFHVQPTLVAGAGHDPAAR